MAKRQNFIVGSTNTNTETQTVTQLNEAWDRYDVLYSGKLDGVFNAVSDYSNDSSNEIANAILSITGSQPTGQSQTELAGALNQMRQDIETSSLTFKGYISATAPSSSTYGLIEGNLWINSATLPTSFPVPASSIQVWNGTAWVAQSDSYTVANFDFWRNVNDNEGYYWFGGQWVVMSTDMSTTYFTLNQTSGKWEIKSSVNLPGSPTTTTPDSNAGDTQIATVKYVKDAIAPLPSTTYFPDLFDWKWADHQVNDMQWLRSDTFSWQDGTVYETAYQHLLDDYSNAPGGTTWANPTQTANLGDYSWQRVIWDGTKYIALSDTGYISTSTDGTTWTTAVAVANLGTDKQWRGLAYNGSIYVALSKTGYISTSTNGTTWTAATYNSNLGSNQWMSVAYGNGVFAAVSNDAHVSVSSDGTTWSVATQSAELQSQRLWNTVRFLNGEFVAIGNTGYISTSSDGISWADSWKDSNIGNKSWKSITYNGTKYLALGNGGWISTSHDLSSWTTPELEIYAYSWVDIVYNGEQVFALSSTGHTSTLTQTSVETIAGITITYRESADGHKIVEPSQEQNVMDLYNATGVAWYYIIDTTNTRFKLPRTKFGATGLRDTVGNYVEPGLPNITGSIVGASNRGFASSATGCFTVGTLMGTMPTDTSNARGNVDMDASLSSSVYGNSNTVQPPATQMYMYFYVGEFTQTATQNTAGLNAELFNGKADVSSLIAETAHVVTHFQAPTAANNYTWYRKYKDGWIEQGGILTTTTPDTTYNVVLPHNMENTNYSIQLVSTTGNNNANIISVYTGTPISVSGFSFRLSNKQSNASTPTHTYWEVKGMALNS